MVVLVGFVLRFFCVEDDDVLALMAPSFLITVKFSFCAVRLLLNDKVAVPNKL